MGTVASIHVIASDGGGHHRDVLAAIDVCFDELRDVERVFSTFRDDSDICRLRDGLIQADEADARVAVVRAACVDAKEATGGRFDAWRRGWFDPTGYVKGWATEKAARRTLAPLLGRAGIDAVGINVGGDIQLFTGADSAWLWHVGVTDPTRSGEVSATMEVRNGAVATSGTAERGAHIIDPRTNTPVIGVASATVVADGLERADLWATTAIVAGFDDLSWIASAGVHSGLVVSSDGRVRRWANGLELTASDRSTAAPDALPFAVRRGA
ncbi:MAG TPA: FAD:protein FMN transferase [Humibacter sp.]|nr:FAD:protein FMN transferase [Humibacter sp.]